MKISTILFVFLNIISLFILDYQQKENFVENSETWGFITNISSSIYEENGEIVGVAKNEFTLGFSTITVTVYLYSSQSTELSISDWDLETTSYIYDLNIGKSIEARCLANHNTYYLCRVKYIKDNDEPVYKDSNYYFYE